MKLGFSQQEIITTAKSLGLPTDGFVQRRVARAFDLVESNKVTEVTDGIFRVRSQYDPSKAYIVNVNHGQPSCNCPDGERTCHCKHRIASLLYARKQAPVITIVKTTDGEDGDYWRRCWLIKQGNRRIMVYEEPDGRLFCNCGAFYGDCEHKQLVIQNVKSQLRFINECGTDRAKTIQSKLNSQLDSQKNNGNGAKAPSQPQLDLRDPFQQSEQLDIDQIEGRRNGELAWNINGKYVISYKGIMSLSQKHDITFTDGDNSNTKQVIARARLNGNERVSGKLPIPSRETALELAKRNAARQLLPLAEIKAVEKKAQLKAEFDWQKAYNKCVELVGGKAQVDIIINDLVNWGKLRQDNPSGYNRTEYLLIHEYCQKEASIERDPKSTNNWSYNSAAFLDRCKEAIEHQNDNSNGDKRKLMMDKKLRTWLFETDGTKTEISCREICEQFESKQNPSIVTRLRAGIDDGADISTVELD